MSHPSRRVPSHPTPRTADPGRCPSCGAPGTMTLVLATTIECGLRSCPLYTPSAERIAADRARARAIRRWAEAGLEDTNPGA